MILIKNGNVHDAIHAEVQVVDILIENGKIAAMGAGLEAPAGAEALLPSSVSAE